MEDESSFGEIINMCNSVGWNKGIKSLEKIVEYNENLQADLFSGSYMQIKQANKLSKTIIKQNHSIYKLKEYRKKNKL